MLLARATDHSLNRSTTSLCSIRRKHHEDRRHQKISEEDRFHVADSFFRRPSIVGDLAHAVADYRENIDDYENCHEFAHEFTPASSSGSGTRTFAGPDSFRRRL